MLEFQVCVQGQRRKRRISRGVRKCETYVMSTFTPQQLHTDNSPEPVITTIPLFFSRISEKSVKV